jgi:hypothetical protein
VDDGITGVICDDPTEMVAAARIADKLFNRDRIRIEAVRRWSSRRMAEEYLQLYRATQTAETVEGAAEAEAAAEG